MTSFDEHTLEVLEYHKIIDILRGLCLTQYGVAKVDEVAPLVDADLIRIKLAEVSQMRDIIRFGQAFPLYRLEDIGEILLKSQTEGIFIEPMNLLAVMELIDVSGSLHDYAKGERDNFPLIAPYLVKLHPFPDLRKAIDKSIDHDGSIKDSASSHLKQIRSDIGSLRRRIIHRLENILSERQKTPGWQDDMVTQRDGRYVIPVLSGQFRQDAGIVHDRSQSGATLYIEPNETVEFNNQLGLLYQQERLEMDRILRQLTGMVGEASDRLLSNIDIIGTLDIIHASAGLSIKTDSEEPRVIGRSRFDIRNARHPLLLYYVEDKSTIVGNDIALDNDRLALIVTGPNTGGKTVALKTVGLLVLMAQSGLHIPVDENTEIGLFDNILADVGDEQSIELSLSTFSSHIRQIVFAVRHSGPNALILLDEIGAGTDPKEGAALAEAILLELIRRKSKVIVTTHYSQLKTLPMTHPEVENASFEFDRASLKPTYRLLIGIPGASYAVEIAQRLGMPADISKHASELLGKGERSLTVLIDSLESELATLRSDKATLEERLQHAAQLEEYYRVQSDKLKNEIDDTRRDSLKEMETLLAESRLEIERLVKNIRESQASKESVKNSHRFLEKARKRHEHLKTKQAAGAKPSNTPAIGDVVWVESLKQEGELAELMSDNRAKVRVGNILVTVASDSLKRIATDSSDKSTAANGGGGLRELTAPGPEIHLRGMTVEEAREALDKFLDSAVISGLTQLYVVHGKGTGALRKSMTEFLKRHTAVASIRLGNWNEGGSGVTVVKLK